MSDQQYLILEHRIDHRRTALLYQELTPVRRSVLRFLRRAKTNIRLGIRYESFFTLTYAPRYYEVRSSKDVSDFMHCFTNFVKRSKEGNKRWRVDKEFKIHYCWRIDKGRRTKRYHYHGLLNLGCPSCSKHHYSKAYKMVGKNRVLDCWNCYIILQDWEREVAERWWKKGFVTFSPLWSGTGAVRYMAKYMSKMNINLSGKKERRHGFSKQPATPKSEWRVVKDHGDEVFFEDQLEEWVVQWNLIRRYEVYGDGL